MPGRCVEQRATAWLVMPPSATPRREHLGGGDDVSGQQRAVRAAGSSRTLARSGAGAIGECNVHDLHVSPSTTAQHPLGPRHADRWRGVDRSGSRAAVQHAEQKRSAGFRRRVIQRALARPPDPACATAAPHNGNVRAVTSCNATTSEPDHAGTAPSLLALARPPCPATFQVSTRTERIPFSLTDRAPPVSAQPVPRASAAAAARRSSVNARRSALARLSSRARSIADGWIVAVTIGARSQSIGLPRSCDERKPSRGAPARRGAEQHEHRRAARPRARREPGPAGVDLAPAWLLVDAPLAALLELEVLDRVGDVDARAR